MMSNIHAVKLHELLRDVTLSLEAGASISSLRTVFRDAYDFNLISHDEYQYLIDESIKMQKVIVFTVLRKLPSIEQ